MKKISQFAKRIKEEKLINLIINNAEQTAINEKTS